MDCHCFGCERFYDLGPTYRWSSGRPINSQVEPTVTPSVHPVRNVNDCVSFHCNALTAVLYDRDDSAS